MKKPSAKKHKLIKIIVSFSTIIIITAFCFIIPLRPTVSETEKRELASFPEFSYTALMSGDYFADISTWFSDTVPFRDTIININSKIQNFLGTSGTLTGFNEGIAGDAIPEPVVPNENTTAAIVAESASSENTAEATSNEAETVTPENVTYPADTSEAQNVEEFGGILICDNAAFEYFHFVQDTADNYIKAINTAATRFSDSSDVFVTIAPSSTDITLNEKVREKISASDQKNAIDYMLGSTSANVKKFNCFDNIKQHRNEYVYFRTDHHWTALAAYYAYEVFCQTKGITALPLSAYEIWSFDGFLGSFYNDSGSNPALGATPDRVDAYIPPCKYSMTVTDENGSTFSKPLLYDKSNDSPTFKYGTFLSGDNPLSTIQNEDKTEGETCLVIKESYGNAFVPFLVYHYKTVYVIDYRHYKNTLSSFLEENPVDDIIFVNNISMTRNPSLVQTLTNFIEG
ncbi:MAG: hypothetical protein IKL10_11160 [Clostridia bacterium]|nr:hypothetical protein [Clostridia bacterium]